MTALKSSPSGDVPGDIEILTDLNLNYVRSVAESDVGWFEQHLAPDFLNTNPDGTLIARAAFLQQISRPSAARNLRCDDVKVRLFGNFAVIHARTTYLKPDGQSGAGRYTDIWSRASGKWLCIAAQVARN